LAGDTLVVAEAPLPTQSRCRWDLAVRSGPPGEKGGEVPPEAVVQTCAIVYARLHGLPLGRAGRPFIGWYGDMEMGGHAWNRFAGPLTWIANAGAISQRPALARHVELSCAGQCDSCITPTAPSVAANVPRLHRPASRQADQ
jgi:hypothetical protein